MTLAVHSEQWELCEPFVIARDVMTHLPVVVAELTDGPFVGCGEAAGVDYKGETPESMTAQMTALAPRFGEAVNRADLLRLLPPGGARNALDCALWDLEAKRSGIPAWQSAGLMTLRPLVTAYTLSLGTPDAMAAAAATNPYPLLKLKLGGDGDVERVKAVKAAAPGSRLIVDANEAWAPPQLERFAPVMAALGVELIEQPLPAHDDEYLTRFQSPVPLCADESCDDLATLPGLTGKYHAINIKLDKTGGLTAALDLTLQARRHGFKLMVGCMLGTSLAMAPAFIVGQWCDYVDLDGPLLQKEDRPNAMTFTDGCIHPFDRRLWG